MPEPQDCFVPEQSSPRTRPEGSKAQEKRQTDAGPPRRQFVWDLLTEVWSWVAVQLGDLLKSQSGMVARLLYLKLRAKTPGAFLGLRRRAPP